MNKNSILKDLFNVNLDESKKQLKCIEKPIGCGKQISQDDFDSWDELTKKEYKISALCKKCQDEFFGNGQQ